MATLENNDNDNEGEESREEMATRHKKECKSLEGEKRSALKKVKGKKGKEKKAALQALEEEYETKFSELKRRHESELQTTGGGGGDARNNDDNAGAGCSEPMNHANNNNNNGGGKNTSDDNSKNNGNKSAAERKRERARQKRQQAREEEMRREREIADETAAAAATSPRVLEEEQISRILEPLQFAIAPVAADGHCLYRAVAAQLLLSPGTRDGDENNATTTNYETVRGRAADGLSTHREEFAPFCEVGTPEIPDFETYVERVRSSADWGGHVELRVLARQLKRPIHVYSAQQQQPLVISPCEETAAAGAAAHAEPIRLSYHLHYYALGEHYNQVVRKQQYQQQPAE